MLWMAWKAIVRQAMGGSKVAVPVGGRHGRTRGVAPLLPDVAVPPEAGALLLRLARVAIAEAVGDGCSRLASSRDLLPATPPPAVLAPAAAFVTLHEAGELRGCVGSLATDRPLWESVISAAVAAALDDPRFLPVTADEVPWLSIDVSVLGPARPLDAPADFQPGRDGVIVDRGGRRGLLLPEVATEHGWGLREMLEGTCWKAGLPPDAWRDPATDVRLFRTTRFSDPGPDRSDGPHP